MASDRKKLVCIEDDRTTARIIAEELQDRGFQLVSVYDGQEGLATILREKPDLVLSDISMPGLSGFELIERLTKMTSLLARLPFIFLTALADRDNQLKGRQLGCDDYLVKPIDFDLLEATIRNRLARTVRQDFWPSEAGLHDREIEVLTWAARGKTSGEIATILGLAARTIDFHLDNARAKLGVSTRIQAVVEATRSKIIDP
jgi:DNA-binding NarL/FixJ family response regulator